MATASSNITFDFNYYRFNGRGSRPTTVPTAEQASFMRSRYSIDQELIDVAAQRVARWATEHGFSVTPREPFPSNQQGKYWLEYHFGGITL